MKRGSRFLTLPFFSKAWFLSTREVRPGKLKSECIPRPDLSSAKDIIAPERHYRGGYSSNRRRPIPGTSTPWIPPSSYERSVNQWLFSDPHRYKSMSTSWFYDGPIDNEKVEIGYNNLSGLWKNPLFTGFGNTVSSNADVKNAENRATTKALLDLANEKAGMGENLFQAVKTANLFFDTGITIINGALALKRGNLWKVLKDLNPKQIRKAAAVGRISQSTANKWLAYHYGWKPLALDAIGLLELLREQLKPALLVHGRGFGFASHKQDMKTAPQGNYPPLVLEEESNLGYMVGLTGQLISSDYSRTVNRVGLFNPVGLAWDLVPFSFVVDWVVPIGDVAHALSATTGMSFVGGYKNLRWDRKFHCSIDPNYFMAGPGPTATYAGIGTKRTALGTFPRPVLYARSPFMGSSRIATVLALLTKLNR